MLRLVSYLGLALTITPPVLVFAGALSHDTSLRLVGLGTILWFGTAVFWIKPDKTEG